MSTWVNSNMVKDTGLGLMLIVMAINILEAIKTIKLTVMELILTVKAISMSVSLKITMPMV